MTLSEKGVTKERTLYDFIHMKCAERKIHRDGPNISGPRGWGEMGEPAVAFLLARQWHNLVVHFTPLNCVHSCGI